MAQEPQQHTEVAGVGIDPGAPPEDTFEFIGRLIYNKFIEAPSEYQEAAEGAKPIKWRQELQALDVVRDDGTPAIFSSSPSMTRGDGVTPLGEGGAAHRLALVWKGITGISMNPEDPASAAFLNHAFRFKTTRYKVGKNRKTGEEYRVRVCEPVELLGGPDYAHVGEVRKLQPREGDQAKGSAPNVPPAPGAVDDNDIAWQLAAVLNGTNKDTAQAAVFASELKTVPMVFGKSLITELAPPAAPLVDLLIEKGYLTDVNGVLTVASQAASPPAAATPEAAPAVEAPAVPAAEAPSVAQPPQVDPAPQAAQPPAAPPQA